MEISLCYYLPSLSLAIPNSWCEFPEDQYGPLAIGTHYEDDLKEKTTIIGIEVT